ncbi:hypothetical protein ACFXG1_27925 [Streptomyces sp. NPDC059248]|uniref:hypothetical protein n=1 Tax=Streptomyces sp. NPDC059248 TaxID=3346791 RepID=UPI0036A24C64
MPLHVLPAPAPALRSVLAALSTPSAVREDRLPALRSVQGPVSPECPLPVHVLDQVDAYATGNTDTRTRLLGWRFLLRGDGATVAAAETLLTPDGWSFSHFFEGPYLASTELALRQAESSATPYQPRLLSVPALYMLTLWLRTDHYTNNATHADGADGTADTSAADASDARLAPADLLIPLAPAPPGITAHRPYRAAELLPVMTLRLTPAPLLGSPA